MLSVAANLGGAPFGPSKQTCFMEEQTKAQGHVRNPWQSGNQSQHCLVPRLVFFLLEVDPLGTSADPEGRDGPGPPRKQSLLRLVQGRGAIAPPGIRNVRREGHPPTIPESEEPSSRFSHSFSSRPPVEVLEVISARVSELNSARDLSRSGTGQPRPWALPGNVPQFSRPPPRGPVLICNLKP